jgi:putative hydrolase of the HAD superfamily
VGKVRAVLFDLDDTLFDHRHCAQAALLGVRDGHACFGSRDAADIEAAHARILEELHHEVMTGKRDLDAARVERFRRLYAWAGVDADDTMSSQAARTYRQGYIDARREVRGAAALLAAVREYAAVVVVSNNLLEEQREKLAHCGLARYVDVLVVSEETGMAKPDPRIFEIALERAGVTAAEAVMVGDSWANDIEGARKAGIRAVWFNRNGESAPAAGVPTIHALEPLDEVLKTILGDDERLANRITRAPASAHRQ